MLKHGILGLLNYGDKTGYEIMTVFRDSLNHFWTAQTSQIYRELQTMEKNGWISHQPMYYRHQRYFYERGCCKVNVAMMCVTPMDKQTLLGAANVWLPEGRWVDFFTGRRYTGIDDYCIRCGACARKCPAQAISLEHGKNNVLCNAHLEKMKEKYSPRYGCGKCQVGVPCESSAPGLKRKKSREA